MKDKLEKAKAKLKQEWEDRPIVIIVAASATAQAVLKAVEVRNETRNSRAWEKEVERRDRKFR